MFPGPGQPDIKVRVDQAVRRLCRDLGTARDLNGTRIPLDARIVEGLAEAMVYAASQAAIRPIPSRTSGVGAPPDNARIIFANDVLAACELHGISRGLRYASPQSFAVSLFNAVAPIIWGTGGIDPRKTFERLRKAGIIRN